MENETTLSIQLKRVAIALLDMENETFVEATKTISFEQIKHEVFHDFFEQYIDATLNSPRSVACKFIDEDNDILTKMLRYEELPDDEHFITMTNDLSGKLFKIMQTVSNSNGSVFVAHVELIGEQYILLMKLDPKVAVQLDLETLDLKSVENILPTATDRVHKCALIKMNYDPQEENVYVLDKQSDGEPAKFFMETFLQATPIPNDRKKTKVLIKELYETIKPTFQGDDEMKLATVLDEEFEHGKVVRIEEAVTSVFEKLAPTINREHYIETETQEFLDKFSERNPGFTSQLEVKRDDLHVVYKTSDGSVLFKYDKRLNNIGVHHDQTSGTYTITIRNAHEIDFGLRKK